MPEHTFSSSSHSSPAPEGGPAPRAPEKGSGFSPLPAGPERESERPVVSVQAEGGAQRAVFTGEWTVKTLHRLAPETFSASPEKAGKWSFDLQEVTALDTAGALVLNQWADRLRQDGGTVSLHTGNERYDRLLKNARQPEDDREDAPPEHGLLTRLANIGKLVCDRFWEKVQLTAFLGNFLIVLFGQLLRPARLRWTSLVFFMEQAGLRAVPIVSLLAFLIGMVVAYMGAEELSKFGAQVFSVKLLEVTILREMGVLITAIVVAGRSSSSFTAQIGAMVANEEVAALESMGLDPMELLVVPRVLALVLTLPMLTFVADIMALFGGGVALWYSMDLSLAAFWGQFYNVVKINNFLVGMVKTPFFALCIALVGCFEGFRATTSAASVGFLTTLAVVEAIFIVIVLDALFALFFLTMGI